MKNRKDRIKTIAIVFLAIMLVLTLFSNTIMNYSLAEVSTQMIFGDQLTTKVRGSGVIESGETYAVSIKESRKIASMRVRTGATVSTGDLLFTLSEADSSELTAARESLTAAEREYETAVLSAGFTTVEREKLESGVMMSLAEKQDALAAAKSKVEAAQAKVDALTEQISNAGENSVDLTQETLDYTKAKKELTEAELDKTNKELAYQAAQTKYNTLLAEGGEGTGSEASEELTAEELEEQKEKEQQRAYELELAKKAMNDAYDAFIDASQTYNDLKAVADEAEKILEEAKQESEDPSGNNELTKALAEATKILDAATTDYSSMSQRFSTELSLTTQFENLTKLRKQVEELSGKATNSDVTSPINGVVSQILYTAGQTTAPDETILTIQPENKACTLQFTVTTRQASRIKVGDAVDVLYNYWGREIYGRVASIRRDPQSRDNSTVVCEMSGDVVVGDNYTVSIGTQSTGYDLVVPTSCIREDNNGKFIYIIESKSTPLGNRYYARRADVEVITSDDTRSAITGTIDPGTYVITTTTKPIENNQMVRLAADN